MTTDPTLPDVPFVPFAQRTWEDLVRDELFMREVIKLLSEGYSYRALAEYFHLTWPTMMKIAPRARDYVNEETRALAATWQGLEYARLEEMKAELFASIMPDHVAHQAAVALAIANGDAPPDAPTPNVKLVNAYARLVVTELAVLTLNRGTLALPDAPAIDGDDNDKASLVSRYKELVEQMTTGMLESGYGFGDGAPEMDEDEELAMNARADNSNTIDDAVVIDDGEWADRDLDSGPGEWRDGKWYPAGKEEEDD